MVPIGQQLHQKGDVLRVKRASWFHVVNVLSLDVASTYVGGESLAAKLGEG
jgi:hypothetical protein